MAFNSNFEVAAIADDGIFVSGSSGPMAEDGLHLRKREVEITQGEAMARGPVPGGLKWQGVVPTEHAFDADQDVTMVGTETYTADAVDGVKSASATFTWTQVIKLGQ
jgi:hypothetical protein